MSDPKANQMPIFGNDPIVRFYLGQGPDAAGRFIEEIWQFERDRLERVHDYIQWLFPLREKSVYNRDAPLITQETIGAFAESDFLRARLRRSAEVMLEFYGLQATQTEEEQLTIVKSVAFEAKAETWLEPGNHNHLRLSRILASTRILGLANYSRALFSCLNDIYLHHMDKISARTHQFWTDAAGQR